MKGVINVLKPPGMTSSDVVVFLRRNLGVKKVGHTGTLDPDAAGVLPICLGKATKISDYITQGRKTYICELMLGTTTDTLDISGKVLTKTDCIPGTRKIIEVIRGFKGENDQIPPMYSAIKVKGKKLYELARQGVTLDIPPRKVFIYKIKILTLTDKGRILLEIECSKGTYIRALCRDIGDTLGCGGTMSFLLRKCTGSFSLDRSHTLDEIIAAVKNGLTDTVLVPIDEVLSSLMPYIILDKDSMKRIINGNKVYADCIVEDTSTDIGEMCRLYCDGVFIGIGYCTIENKKRYVRLKTMLM